MTATPEDAAGAPVPRGGVPPDLPAILDTARDLPDEDAARSRPESWDDDVATDPESGRPADSMSADVRAAADAFFASLQSGAAPVRDTAIADERPGLATSLAVRPDEPPAVDGHSDRDWAWVEEWRAGGEPTPWGPGIAFAAFVALVIGTAVFVLSSGLRDAPLWAFVSNIVAAAFLAPALWMARKLPVFRWISLGGFVGVIVAWLALLLFPVPTF